MEHKENNYEFLESDLKYLGFDASLNDDLKEMLGTEADSFESISPYHAIVQNEHIEALLFFYRLDPEGFFFFSNYKLSVGGKQVHLQCF